MTTTTPGPGPGLRKIQLGHALRRLREDAGKQQQDAADAVDCARSRISMFESGSSVPRKIELPLLLALYGASCREAELEEIRLQAHQRGWWAAHQLPLWLQTYISLESDADRVRCFALELVPGLLQTPDYAREHLECVGVPSDQAERHVAARLERQQRIGKGQELEVTLSEALLHRTYHMGPVGRDQLRSLAEMAFREGVTIRVLPFGAGGHASMTGSFTLLTFPEGLITPMGYHEYADGGHMADAEQDVSRLNELYRALQARSLDQRDSALMIGTWARKEGPG